MMNKLLYLSLKDVVATQTSMPEIIGALETMFRDKAAGRTEMPPKPGIHPKKDCFIHAMPAYIPSMKSAGIKWISGFPTNQEKNISYITGLLILNDPETGVPISVMDATWITAQRTAAASAIGAKYLASPKSNVLGIIGCGVQGKSHVEAFSHTFKLEKILAYDLHDEVTRRFADEMQSKYKIPVQVVSSAKTAVSEADLVVTSGPILKNPTPTIEKDWLRPGAFASAVDFDSYWDKDSLAQFNLIATDDIAQMEYYRKEGYFKQTPKAHCELADIVVGRVPKKPGPQDRILCLNLGIALDDMATAIKIYDKAVAKKMGQWLEL